MKKYLDFEVWLGSSTGSAHQFPVQVFSSPAGPAEGALSLDLSDHQFQAHLAKVRGIEGDLELRKDFGHKLFKALFSGNVRDVWIASRGRVNAGQADGLRLRLRIDDADIALLPWELLWEGFFLATASDLVVSRYLPVPEPSYYAVQTPLRILVVTESPAGVPPIAAKESDQLENAIKNMGASVDLKVLKNATTAEIQNALQQDYHAMHFLGHGTSQHLFLTGADGKRDSINDQAFSQFFLGRRSLRLVVLNACSTSQAKEGGLFSGIGPSLIEKGVPAVIAMQYPFVQLETAGGFSKSFYAALANGLPVDVAVNNARQSLSATGSLLGERDWSTPILYMGTRSAHILDSIHEESDQVEGAWQSLQTAAQQSGVTGALSELSRRFQEVSNRHRKLVSLVDLLSRYRSMRAAFTICLNAVRSTGGVIDARNLELIKQSWVLVQNNFLNAITVFVQAIFESEMKTRHQSVVDCAKSIEDNIRSLALGALAQNVETFDTKVVQAENQISQMIDQALIDVVAFSDQTLGKLNMA